MDDVITGINTDDVARPNCADVKLIKQEHELRLKPEGGNRLSLNDRVVIVPDGGIALTPAGLAAGTTYYIYAAISGAALAIVASEAAPAMQCGLKVNAADPAQRLVGMARTADSGAWVDDPNRRFVRSAFNDGGISAVNQPEGEVWTEEHSLVELGSMFRAEFLLWGDEIGIVSQLGSVRNTLPHASMRTGVGFNGIHKTAALTVVTCPLADQDCNASGTDQMADLRLEEGYNFVTLVGYTNGGRATWRHSSRVVVTTHGRPR